MIEAGKHRQDRVPASAHRWGRPRFARSAQTTCLGIVLLGMTACSYGRSLGTARVTVNDSAGACFESLKDSERYCIDAQTLASVVREGSLGPTEFAVGDCVLLRDYHPTLKVEKRVPCPG